MLLTLKLLALSPTLALRWPLVLIAAGAGAVAGVGYTLLAGAEVPTVRSCVAALLVLVGLAAGRDALTLRLIATGGARGAADPTRKPRRPQFPTKLRRRHGDRRAA
jgi:competence protein ComEC